MTPNYQAQVEALRLLVEEQTVECPACHNIGGFDWERSPYFDGRPGGRELDPNCGYTGRIPDPLYATLREALRVECTRHEWADSSYTRCVRCWIVWPRDGSRIPPTGYVTRNVKGCTSSMVAGLIVVPAAMALVAGLVVGIISVEAALEIWEVKKNWLVKVFDSSDPATYAIATVTEAIQQRAAREAP